MTANVKKKEKRIQTKGSQRTFRPKVVDKAMSANLLLFALFVFSSFLLCLAGSLVGWLVGWLAGWLVGCLVVCTLACLFDSVCLFVCSSGEGRGAGVTKNIIVESLFHSMHPPSIYKILSLTLSYIFS